MHDVELILGLLLLTGILAALARRIAVPYPLVLVVGGLALGLLPLLGLGLAVPAVRVDPELAFVLFLPPILYQAAIFTSWRDFRANLRAISFLAVGLVVASTLVVAWVAHMLYPGLPWAACFVLGAIVSPPDAVAATAVLQRLKVPRRVVTILEGESLVNDASALVIYKFAVAAVVTGSFALGEAVGNFVLVAVGGTAVGLAIGWGATALHRHMKEPGVELLVSLLTPFAAYLAAEAIATSGVLAVVAAGLLRGWYSPEKFGPRTRMQAYAVWGIVVFLLNGIVFILIGFELSRALAEMAQNDMLGILWEAGLVALAAIAVRLVWVFASAWVDEITRRGARARRNAPAWRETSIIAWCGMRGIVSLAAALALPAFTAAGEPFPGRGLIVLVSFAVIFATLVVQGSTLPFFIRLLRVGVDSKLAREERVARIKATYAAMGEIDRLHGESAYPADVLDAIRGEYKRRMMELRALARAGDSAAAERTGGHWRDARLAAIAAERRRILKLRRDRIIGDEALRRVQFELDLEEIRLG